MTTLVEKMEITTLLRPRLLVLTASLAALVAIYWSTLMSMVAIWERSETFTHGYFIFPISLYLIWSNRKQLSQQPAASDWRALVVLLGLGLLWFLSRSVSVLVVEQLAFVMMIPTLVWLFCGLTLLRSITFPLAFMIFAVPMGEVLITPMMNMTAVFVIEAVRLTGIPIYAEGTFFSLPTGDWSVVEGCSGVRYLIASVTLGTLYAYLNYSRYTKRTLFIIASFVVPVIANWLRAFIIVMLGHFSGMTIATGVDHLIYGWFFFGIVIFLLFWIGSYWRDPPEGEADVSTGSVASTESFSRWLPLAGIATGVLVLWPWLLHQQSQAGMAAVTLPQQLPIQGDWRPHGETISNWAPRYVNPTQVVASTYTTDRAEDTDNTVGGERPVGVYLQYYASQDTEGELINSQNVMVEQKHPTWRQLGQQQRPLDHPNGPATVWETHLNSPSQDLLIWHWHEIGGVTFSNPYLGKLLQAYQKLLGDNAEGVAYILYTPIDGDRDRASARLQQFVDSNVSGFQGTLSQLFNAAASGDALISKNQPDELNALGQ